MKPATLDTVTAAPSGYLFEIVGLERKFEDGQVQALQGVTFSVVQGEFVAITGPSGCGKTTLLQLLGALDRPTAGTLAISPPSCLAEKGSASPSPAAWPMVLLSCSRTNPPATSTARTHASSSNSSFGSTASRT
jgi:ABC-type glutathione transport system ATPase component